MNIYVIAEGEKAIKKIYQKWIPFVNANLNSVDYPEEIVNNNFILYFGFGQPGFWNHVGKAIEDVNSNKLIDRLVIAFDSEEMTYQEKLSEAKDYVSKFKCRVETRYIVQHFCIETWLMGNRDIFRKKPHDNVLREYYIRYDVRNEDPDGLPNYPQKGMNTRAQFAYEYLRAGIHDMHGSEKFYNKKNPGIVLEESYFKKVKNRFENNKHIQSFDSFLNAFI